VATRKDNLVNGVQPSLSIAISQAIESRLADVHTALPAHVESYDKASGMCSVKIDLKRKFRGGQVVEVPIIPNVPVLQLRGAQGDAIFHIPVEKGDTGMVIFSERSLDSWLVKGGTLDPEDSRKFDYTDATFYPGLYPRNKKISSISNDLANNMAVAFGSHGLRVSKDGKIAIKGAMNGELLGIIDNLMTLITTMAQAFLIEEAAAAAITGGMPILQAQLNAMKM
jgi:hypothetical protein